MNRLLLALERWLVPLLVLTIGGVQMANAKLGMLSPWKGGGFGMFASVDAPSMRLLTAYGVDASGVVHAVDPWGSQSARDRRRLITVPTSSSLGSMARDLLASQFVPAGSRTLAAFERLASANPQAGLRPAAAWDVLEPIHRLRREGDPGPPHQAAVRFVEMRLHLWQLSFEHPDARVRCRLLVSVLETLEPPP